MDSDGILAFMPNVPDVVRELRIGSCFDSLSGKVKGSGKGYVVRAFDMEKLAAAEGLMYVPGVQMQGSIQNASAYSGSDDSFFNLSGETRASYWGCSASVGASMQRAHHSSNRGFEQNLFFKNVYVGDKIKLKWNPGTATHKKEFDCFDPQFQTLFTAVAKATNWTQYTLAWRNFQQQFGDEVVTEISLAAGSIVKITVEGSGSDTTSSHQNGVHGGINTPFGGVSSASNWGDSMARQHTNGSIKATSLTWPSTSPTKAWAENIVTTLNGQALTEIGQQLSTLRIPATQAPPLAPQLSPPDAGPTERERPAGEGEGKDVPQQTDVKEPEDHARERQIARQNWNRLRETVTGQQVAQRARLRRQNCRRFDNPELRRSNARSFDTPELRRSNARSFDRLDRPVARTIRRTQLTSVARSTTSSTDVPTTDPSSVPSDGGTSGGRTSGGDTSGATGSSASTDFGKDPWNLGGFNPVSYVTTPWIELCPELNRTDLQPSEGSAHLACLWAFYLGRLEFLQYLNFLVEVNENCADNLQDQRNPAAKYDAQCFSKICDDFSKSISLRLGRTNAFTQQDCETLMDIFELALDESHLKGHFVSMTIYEKFFDNYEFFHDNPLGFIVSEARSSGWQYKTLTRSNTEIDYGAEVLVRIKNFDEDDQPLPDTYKKGTISPKAQSTTVLEAVNAATACGQKISGGNASIEDDAEALQNAQRVIDTSQEACGISQVEPPKYKVKLDDGSEDEFTEDDIIPGITETLGWEQVKENTSVPLMLHNALRAFPVIWMDGKTDLLWNYDGKFQMCDDYLKGEFVFFPMLQQTQIDHTRKYECINFNGNHTRLWGVGFEAGKIVGSDLNGIPFFKDLPFEHIIGALCGFFEEPDQMDLPDPKAEIHSWPNDPSMCSSALTSAMSDNKNLVITPDNAFSGAGDLYLPLMHREENTDITVFHQLKLFNSLEDGPGESINVHWSDKDGNQRIIVVEPGYSIIFDYEDDGSDCKGWTIPDNNGFNPFPEGATPLLDQEAALLQR